MNYNWIRIKEEIAQEVRKDFIHLENCDLNDILDIFIKVLLHPLDEPSLQLDGLVTRVPNAFHKILLEDLNYLDRLSYFPDVAKIEPFLRKIYYLISKDNYSELVKKRKGLDKLISGLNLNPTGISFNKQSLEENLGKPNFTEHLYRVYHLRNIESHQCENWSRAEFYLNLKSVLIIYLYSILVNYDVIKAIVDPEPDLTAYTNSIINKYRSWFEKFIHIAGIEEIYDERKRIEIYAIETDWDLEENDNDFDKMDGESIDIRERREGRIIDLRKNIRHMVILGPPGVGKTASLKYLTFIDAKNSSILPIYLELRHYTENYTIRHMIQDKLKFSDQYITELLQAGKLSLFLDGLNEVILPNLIIQLRKEIQGLLIKYHQCPIIISCRPQFYYNDFKIPVFQLQLMNELQVKEFINKNYGEKSKTEQFFDILKKHNRLFQLSRNPLILKILLSVVQKEGGQIPENTGKLIRTFMQNIFLLEEPRNPIFNRIETQMLLSYLAFHTRLKRMIGFSINTAFDILKNKKASLGLNTDLLSFIKIVSDLNIIECEYDKLSFSHEMYQEYFAAEELLSLTENNLDLIDELLKDDNWRDPVNIFSGLTPHRVDVIRKIVTSNPLLAAECLNNSVIEENELLDEVIYRAEHDALDFNNIKKSAIGFLALYELDEFDKIFNIIKDINDSERIHHNIISKIITNSSLVKAIDFLTILIKTNNRSLINSGVYNLFKFNFEETDIEKIKPIILYLKKSGNFYLLSKLATKIDLQSLFNISNFVKSWIRKKEFTIAYELINKYNLKDEYCTIEFINSAIEIGTPKCINLVLEIVGRYKLYDQFNLRMIISDYLESEKGFIKIHKKHGIIFENLLIENNLTDEFPIDKLIPIILKQGNQSGIKLAIYWIEKYSLDMKFPPKMIISSLLNIDYINKSRLTLAKQLIKEYELDNKLYNIQEFKNILKIKKSKNESKSKKNNIESLIISDVTKNVLVGLNIIRSCSLQENYHFHSTLDKIFNFESGYKINLKFDKIIEDLLEVYNSDLQTISLLLRKYNLSGTVKHIKDYGAYIKCIELGNSKLFFLHKDQIVDKSINHPNEVLSENQIVNFRIIGVNPSTFRINISCLEKFKIE